MKKFISIISAISIFTVFAAGLSACGHKHDYQLVNVTDPTCTERGYSTYVCDGCGDTVYDDYVEAKGHKEIPCEDAQPTCISKGHTGGTKCEVCGETLIEWTEFGNYADHDFEVTQVLEKADCVHTGIEAVSCKVCGYETQRVTDFLGHDYEDGNCVRCDYPVATEGLELVEDDDGYGYVLKGIGSVTSKDIVIPSDYNGKPVYAMQAEAFSDCDGIESITVPDSIQSIPYSAFYNCANLKTLSLGCGVTSIGYSAFGGCENLTDVYYRGSLGQWCDISFDNDKANPMAFGKNFYIGGACVTQIVIPETVAKINKYAFYGCENVTEVVLSDAITEIGEGAFDGCNRDIFNTDGNCDYLASATNSHFCLYKVSSSTAQHVTVFEGTKIIGYQAFDDCKSLTEIIIPEGVETICDWAFYGCGNLESITLPASLKSLGDYAFYGCRMLLTVNFGGTVEQWNALETQHIANYATGDAKIICTDGELTLEKD